MSYIVIGMGSITMKSNQSNYKYFAYFSNKISLRLPMIVGTALLHYSDCNETKQCKQINNEKAIF